MKLTNRKDVSKWAYWQCVNGNDIEEIRSLITHSEWAFNYCYHIKDIEEIRNRIKDSFWAFNYCYHIKDREDIRKYVTSPSDLYFLKKERERKNETIK